MSNEALIKLKIADFACMFFAACSVGASVLQNELEYQQIAEEERDYLLVINSIAIIFLIAAILIRYKKWLRYMVAKGYLTKIDTLNTTRQWKFIISEWVVALIGPNFMLKDIEFEEDV